MRIVMALGGNALGDNLQEQMTAARITAGVIADMAEEGHEIAVVHGNGPQVGMIETAFETAAKADKHFPVLPMSVCVALSQGYIGYDLQNAIRWELDLRGMENPVAAIITQVEVDPDDSAFQNLTKPIGSFLTKEEAEALQAKGVPVREDSVLGWRQVVASPKPVNIIEVETVKTMLAAGQIPIVAGGGGIPVTMKGRQYRGMGAVIDKNFSAAKLAELVAADMLIILTSVEKAAINSSHPDPQLLDTITVDEAEYHIANSQFTRISMLFKMQAAVSFVRSCAGRGSQQPSALITLLTRAKDGIAGKTGTRIVAG